MKSVKDGIPIERILEGVKGGLTRVRQANWLSGEAEETLQEAIEALETVLVYVAATKERSPNRVVIVGVVDADSIQEVFADRPGELDVILVDLDDGSDDRALVAHGTPVRKLSYLDPETWAAIQAGGENQT